MIYRVTFEVNNLFRTSWKDGLNENPNHHGKLRLSTSVTDILIRNALFHAFTQIMIIPLLGLLLNFMKLTEAFLKLHNPETDFGPILFILQHWKPLNEITLGQAKSSNINRMITMIFT